ncbi:MAG: hypothetical protein R6U17_01525 [Thermoplasmata archaeon]
MNNDAGMDRFNMPTNRYPLDDFEGFTPNEMHGLLYTPYYDERSPLYINPELDDERVDDVRICRYVKKYLGMLRERQPLKLTAKGNLPRNFCRELCEADILEGDRFAFKDRLIMREEASYYIHFMNVFTQLIGFTCMDKGSISSTEKAEEYLDSRSPSEWFTHLFKAHTEKFNWGYSDYYSEAEIIQGGFGFSIFLVQKYGDEPRKVKFYTEKFLKAFPSVLSEFPDKGSVSGKKLFRSCYETRMFERFLERFGLIEYPGDEEIFSSDRPVVKKDLIDHVFKWKIL